MTRKIIAVIIFCSLVSALAAASALAAPFKSQAPATLIAPGGATVENSLAGKGTREISIPSRGAVSYAMPETAKSTFETTIEKLTVRSEELPDGISLASVAKMKTNPHISTTQSDFAKICKEAFRNKVSATLWRAAQTSFYSAKSGEDDTVYIIVAVEYKRDTTYDAYQKDVSSFKRYLKKETSDEYVLMEKFPFLVVIASNQNGDYEFSVVKDIGERLKIKFYGTSDVAGQTINYDAGMKTTAENSIAQDIMKQNSSALQRMKQNQNNAPPSPNAPPQPQNPAGPQAPPPQTKAQNEKAVPTAQRPPAQNVPDQPQAAATAEVVVSNPEAEQPARNASKNAGTEKTAVEKASKTKAVQPAKNVVKKAETEKPGAEAKTASQTGGIKESKTLQKLREKLEGGKEPAKPQSTAIEEDVTPDEN